MLGRLIEHVCITECGRDRGPSLTERPRMELPTKMGGQVLARSLKLLNMGHTLSKGLTILLIGTKI